jgi:hypothetical protein
MKRWSLAPPLRKLSLQLSIFHTVRRNIFSEFSHHHGFVIRPVLDVHFGSWIILAADFVDHYQDDEDVFALT